MVLKSAAKNVGQNYRLIIQPAAMKDTKAISKVLAHSFYNFSDSFSWLYPFLRFTIDEDLRHRLRSQSPLYSCLVAKIVQSEGEDAEQTVVGTAEIALRSLSLWMSKPQHPYISNLAVHRDFRRMGIGSQLLAKCEQIAFEWGYRETRLHVLDRNNSAKDLYYNNGYQISQIEANWSNLWFDYSPRLLLKKLI